MKKIAAILALALLSGCGTIYDTDPVGVGYDVNELKLSPCACIQVETLPGLPEWFATATA